MGRLGRILAHHSSEESVSFEETIELNLDFLIRKELLDALNEPDAVVPGTSFVLHLN